MHIYFSRNYICMCIVCLHYWEVILYSYLRLNLELVKFRNKLSLERVNSLISFSNYWQIILMDFNKKLKMSGRFLSHLTKWIICSLINECTTVNISVIHRENSEKNFNIYWSSQNIQLCGKIYGKSERTVINFSTFFSFFYYNFQTFMLRPFN